MKKFSLIIPVYNVEKYIKKCLDSVFEQSFKDFEVIVVNDGTKDKSMDIVKNYDVQIINQKNMGLSEARNNGVKNAKGEYLLFLDSDDYIEKDLLKKINESLNNNPDIVRFQAKDIIEDKIVEYNEKSFSDLDGVKAFEIIAGYHYVEPACFYAIKRSYYNKNNFSFKKDKYHEDFGLIPLVIYKSNKVNSIDYCGYCYVRREGSITRYDNYQKALKKVEDTIYHYDYLMNEVDKIKKDNTFFKSFISNSILIKITELKRSDYKKYLKELKERKIFDNLLNDTKGRKIKNFLLKMSPKVYYKIKGK